MYFPTGETDINKATLQHTIKLTNDCDFFSSVSSNLVGGGVIIAVFRATNQILKC